jgi:hypothetical protein
MRTACSAPRASGVRQPPLLQTPRGARLSSHPTDVSHYICHRLRTEPIDRCWDNAELQDRCCGRKRRMSNTTELTPSFPCSLWTLCGPGVPQSPMLPADPSRLHSKHPSSVMGGARLSLAPSSASSSSSSGGGGKVTMSFSRMPGQMVPSLAASTHPLFSPTPREHTRAATPRHHQPPHAREVSTTRGLD